MKFIIVPILILLVATQAFSKWVIVLEFQLNKEYIANNLCENKAKPVLKCGGKCQLTKALKKTENESPSSNQNPKSTFLEVLFCYEASVLTTLPPNKEASPAYALYAEKKYASPLHAIYHPPRA